ncbi:MAG: hypothetical protein PHS80_02680 [Methanothrix sp.]|nr:hypothetical protein [Methanothrix sp.]
MDLIKELISPAEPKDMLQDIITFKQHLSDQKDGDWDSDSQAIWLKNMIPSYLWKNWKHTLTEAGFTWPKFLKHMKYHTRDMKRLLEMQINWDEFTSLLKKTLDEDTKRKPSTIN